MDWQMSDPPSPDRRGVVPPPDARGGDGASPSLESQSAGSPEIQNIFSPGSQVPYPSRRRRPGEVVPPQHPGFFTPRPQGVPSQQVYGSFFPQGQGGLFSPYYRGLSSAQDHGSATPAHQSGIVSSGNQVNYSSEQHIDLSTGRERQNSFSSDRQGMSAPGLHFGNLDLTSLEGQTPASLGLPGFYSPGHQPFASYLNQGAFASGSQGFVSSDHQNTSTPIMNSLSAGEDRFAHQKQMVKEHIEKHPESVCIFLERAPHALKTSSTCKLVGCDIKMDEGDYRIAVYWGMFSANGDFYHPKCFEKVADFHSLELLDILYPLTRETWEPRGLKVQQLDGRFFLDGGAERLVWEWMDLRRRSVTRKLGIPDSGMLERVGGTVYELLHRAGSATYIAPTDVPEGIEQKEFDLHLMELAPIESDGVGDENEWSLFKEYISLGDEQPLSRILQTWKRDYKIIHADEESLKDKGRERLDNMSSKQKRAMKRLGFTPT